MLKKKNPFNKEVVFIFFLARSISKLFQKNQESEFYSFKISVFPPFAGEIATTALPVPFTKYFLPSSK